MLNFYSVQKRIFRQFLADWNCWKFFFQLSACKKRDDVEKAHFVCKEWKIEGRGNFLIEFTSVTSYYSWKSLSYSFCLTASLMFAEHEFFIKLSLLFILIKVDILMTMLWISCGSNVQCRNEFIWLLRSHVMGMVLFLETVLTSQTKFHKSF